MKKKIWICGASGMLGSHFKELLAEQNIPFITDRMDITKLDTLSDFVRVNKLTHIINCAAYTQVDKAEESEEQQKAAYLINAVGPHNLGIAGRRHGGVRVIHFSTDYVFDGLGRNPYDENHLCTPIGSYGMSKFAGEMKLLDEHQHACIIRTSWLFGHPGNNFVNKVLQLMQEKELLKVVSDQIGRPTYCRDLAEAALLLLDDEGIFHFANSQETNWYQFAKEIHQQALQLGFPLKIRSIEPVSTYEYPTPAKRPAYSALSTRKFEQHTGYKPRPWKEALHDYLLRVKDLQPETHSV